MSAAGSQRSPTDPHLGELLELQRVLLEATRAWASGADPGPEATAARHQALRLNHLRYQARVPSYGLLAEKLGGAGPAGVDFIVDNLLFPDLFKSYDPAALASRDFPALTRWLGEVSTWTPELDLDGVADLSGWRGRLRAAGVYLTYSSGTSGRMSFVPRDPLTWRALCTNGAAYTDRGWDGTGQFDCLVAGPRGEGLGILDAAAGLARAAARTHFLFETRLTTDDVWGLSHSGGTADAGLAAAAHADGSYQRAFEFLRSGAGDGRRVLVFGAPFQVRRLCDAVAAAGGIASAPGSLVVTGGGWKSFRGEILPRRELLALVERALGIAPGACIDAYSTAELNCTFRTCAHGRYHVPPLVEAVVLDEALHGATGRTGRGLLGFLDPFALSYPGFVLTGDVARLDHGRCECGLAGSFIDGEIERAAGVEIRGCGGVLESIRV